MNPGVNLVPMVRRVARARARRRAVWTGVVAVLGLLVAVAWGIESTAAGALGHLFERVQAIERQRTEVRLRLAGANGDRDVALQGLQTLTAARRPQPWARRLVALTEAAPDGVFLTALVLSDGQTESRSPGRGGVSHRGTGNREQGTGGAGVPPANGVSPVSAGGRDARPAPGAQDVRLLGYALDHGALIQLLNTLQNLPGWQQVELVRATSEPFRTGLAVAFELACTTQEDGL